MIQKWVKICFQLMLGTFLSFEASGRQSATQDRVEPSPPAYDFKVETGWITVRDGTRLAATYYKPVPKTPDEAFPVLFEFLPYRKDTR